MCPFCIGAATWAAAGVISAGGLGMLAAVVNGQRRAGATSETPPEREGGKTVAQRPVD